MYIDPPTGKDESEFKVIISDTDTKKIYDWIPPKAWPWWRRRTFMALGIRSEGGDNGIRIVGYFWLGILYVAKIELVSARPSCGPSKRRLGL